MLYGVPVTDGVPWAAFIAVSLLIVRALVKGDLVPRKTHEDALHNAEMWRAAHMISEAARQEERDQKKELLEHARTTTALITSLPKVQGEDNHVE